MDDDTLCSIGDVARRTGLTVKAIRFYADRGIVPPTHRNPAGYRLYDVEAVARLELVRTLRDLGLDLATIRKVVDREISLQEVAAAHADALAVQIRTLRLRRAVLTRVAKRGSTPEELDLMHKLAKLSEDQRRQLIDDFLDTAFAGLRQSLFDGVKGSLTPTLPANPDAEQAEAWAELVELTQDPDFRDSLRRLGEQHEADWMSGEGGRPRPNAAAIVRQHVGPALEAGIAPDSPEAEPVVAAVMAQYARLVGPDDELGHRLLSRVEAANDPRRYRYLQLLATINGWSAPEDLAPVLEWFIRAGGVTR